MKDEMDILKEVGSIAAAHGSTALSEMLGRKINLSVPTLSITTSAEIEGKLTSNGASTIVLQTNILTGLKKESLYVIMDEKNAYRLVDICCKSDELKGSAFTEMAMSLIKEIGNVVISAYIGALGHFLKKVIIPSLPIMINAPFQEIVRLISSSSEKGSLMLIESTFEEPKSAIKGQIWLILTSVTVEEIKVTCKKTLEDL